MLQAFQEVSLVQIAEDMLRQCKGFDESLSLFIPESALVQTLVFKSPVVLYVSQHNLGAAQAFRASSARGSETSACQIHR